MIKLKNLLKENLSGLKSISDVKLLVPELVLAAQEKYNEWDQDEDGEDPELGYGGICQDIADGMADVFNNHGIDATIVDSGGVGDQHVWTVIKVKEGVYEVDIPPSIYESGSGYVWKKRPGVTFSNKHIYITLLSNNPDDFDDYINY